MSVAPTAKKESFAADLLIRALASVEATMSREVARLLVQLDFPPEDHARYQVLAEKVQNGALTPGEEVEIDGFVEADSLLSILRLKAERLLKQ